MDVGAIKEIDACGLTCPLPILRTKKALAQLESGQLLRVLTTDPNSLSDFQIFSEKTGNRLLETHKVGDVFSFLLQRR